MALNADKLKSVQGLTPEQVREISTLSQNDEDQVIYDKVRDIHTQYDRDILEVTGKQKPGTMKTYDHLKQVLSELKEAASGGGELQKQLDQLKREKADLENQIKDGKGDEAIRKQLTELQGQLKEKESHLKKWEDKYKTEIKAKEDEIAKKENEALQFRVESEIDKALSKLKFKDPSLLPASLKELAVTAAKTELLNNTKYGFESDGNGGKTLVFYDANGNIMRNPNNSLHPFTADELLAPKLEPVLDPGRKATGTGKEPQRQQSSGGGLYLGDAKSKTEALTKIQAHIISLGIERGTEAFTQKQNELWKENNVAALPDEVQQQ